MALLIFTSQLNATLFILDKHKESCFKTAHNWNKQSEIDTKISSEKRETPKLKAANFLVT